MATARLATRSDQGTLADVLAHAFAADPIWRWLAPDDHRYTTRAPAMFAEELHQKVRQGHVYTTDERSGAALWAPPGMWKTSPLGALGALVPGIRLLGPSGIRRGIELIGRMERAHPRDDHWYLAVLGTHPDHQGRGVGSAVVEPVLARCDLDGVPAYLESSNPANVAFYERHGFRVTGQVTPTGGPPLDSMWRDPQPPRRGSG